MQEHTGGERREAAAAAGAHVDHRLADHGAAGHPAEEAGGDVGDALAPRLAVLVRAGVGDVVDQLGGEQRLEQADDREGEGVGGDDRQRLEVERHARAGRRPGSESGRAPMSPTVGTVMPSRPPPTPSTAMATRGAGTAVVRRGRPTMMARPRADHHVHGQCPRRRRGRAGPGRSGWPGRSRSPTITVRGMNRISRPTPRAPKAELDGAGQDRGGEQVLDAVVLDQRDDHQGHGPGGGRDHGRPPAGEGDDHRDA